MPHAILLGNAQDAGVPQAGCLCPNCRAAWASPALRKYASALGLLDASLGQWFLIDATPDFREQLHLMQVRAPEARWAGILLTHAHIGHYAGLVHVGYEAMATRELPVYATQRMNDFLRTHAPWKQLVTQGNIVLHLLVPNEWRALTPELAIKPLLVPHRDEWSDTVAFIVRGPTRQLLYLPDIDGWQDWEHSLTEVIAEVDIALLDGSFFSPAELPGRDIARIGHPLVTDTAERLAASSKVAEVRFIHLNHSNPLHHAGPEREWLAAHGLKIGEVGDEWEL